MLASAQKPAAALWSGELRAARTVALESPAAADAAVLGRAAYVPLRDGRIISVDLETGSVQWTVPLAATQGLAAGDGLVFATTETALVALAADDGASRWTVSIEGGFAAPPVADGGWLIAATAAGEVLCLRGSDGTVLWAARPGAGIAARPAIGHDRVFVSLEDGHVVALDLQTGAAAWQRRLGGRPGAPLAAADRVFVGAADRWFYALSTKDGGQQWRWRHGGLIAAAPAVDARHVYVTGYNNVLRALDRSGGSQRWMRGLPLRPMGGPLLLDDVVVVAGVGAEVLTYRTTRLGEPAGQFAGASDLAAPPLLVPHPVPELMGVLLVTRSGELQFLRRPLGVAVTPLTEMIGVPVPLGAPPAP